ncbi:hypothetical protein KCU85_g10048, partial [Aureobasidium melanogenum]
MKGGKTLVQVAKEILNEYPDGLTLQDICDKSNGAQSKSGQAPRTAKNSMGATLSQHKELFRKELSKENKKYKWYLIAPIPGIPTQSMNESLDQSLVTHTTNTPMALTTPREQEPSEGRSMTNNGVSEREDQVETNGNDATTPLETSSAATAQKIDFIIESAGSPRTGGTDGPAVTLEVEPSQQSHLHELQQTSPPLVDRREESSARGLQPAIHEGRDATIPDLPPGLVAGDRSVVAVPLIAPEMEPADVVVGEAQDASVDHDMTSLEALRPLLANVISTEVARFDSRRHEELPALGEHLPSRAHSDIDVHAIIEDMLRPLRGTVGLDSTLAQPAVLVNRSDAHRALDDIRLARGFRKRFDEAISKCDSTLATMIGFVNLMNEPIAHIESFKNSLQAYKAQATASQRLSRKSLNAFIDDQDDDDQVI